MGAGDAGQQLAGAEVYPGTSLAGQQTTERWLGQLADRVVQEWDGLPMKSTNNHSYWAAWAVMASAVALDRRDLFAWSLKEYRIAAGQIAADGTLANEQRRRERALAYHNYALQPLVMIASFAAANKVDVTQENHGALARLVNYVLQQKDADLEWLEPWCALSHCSSVTLSRLDASRPLQDRPRRQPYPTLSALNLRHPAIHKQLGGVDKAGGIGGEERHHFCYLFRLPMRPSDSRG
jgi:hypothetical protein